MTAYSELRLRIDRGVGRGSYRVVATGPAGEALGRFKLPFSEIELENFILKVGSTRRGRRRIESPEMELAKDFGTKLFGALFGDEVRELYRSSFAESRSAGRGLRITLSLTGAPELLQVPWEYLYDHPSFLSISTWTPIVRYLDLPKPRRPLQVELPIRVLALVSSPSDAEPIDAQQERTKLEGAVAPLIELGAIAIDWLEEASLRALQRQLRKEDYHVFHFIGHGGYDQNADDGVLLFEDEYGRGRRISGIQLGTILADEVSLRLAVLNSCEGGRSSLQDPFSGVATSLIEREIPAVIGMQFEITDRAAIVFAGEFYSALADGLPVDSAVAEARKAIYADQNDVEWGTPVLFMRVADGRLFDVKPHAPIRRRQKAAPEREPEPAVQPDTMAAVAADRVEAEHAEPDRTEADRIEADRAEEEQREAERIAAAQRAAEAARAEAAADAARVDAQRIADAPSPAEAGVAARERRQPGATASVERERTSEAWVSEQDVISPYSAGAVRSDDGDAAAATVGITAATPLHATGTSASETIKSAETSSWNIPPGLVRIAGRGALGGLFAAAFGDLWYLAGRIDELQYVLEGYVTYAAILAIALAIVVSLAEVRVPALRVPSGSLYQLANGNRVAAAAIQGALAGATVAFIVVILLFGSGGYLTFEVWLGEAVIGAMSFAIAEWLIQRILRGRS
jgi:hypothetical protein